MTGLLKFLRWVREGVEQGEFSHRDALEKIYKRLGVGASVADRGDTNKPSAVPVNRVPRPRKRRRFDWKKLEPLLKSDKTHAQVAREIGCDYKTVLLKRRELKAGSKGGSRQESKA